MTPSAAVWQQLFVDLAVNVTVAVAATAFLSRWLSRPAWRRPLWQACTLAMVGIVFFELVGFKHELTLSHAAILKADSLSKLPI